jgi:hypothetical protein
VSTSLSIFLGLIVSFSAVFLKGFQHQNVIGGHYRWAFFVSYLMAIFDVLAVGLVVDKGWLMAAPYGTGAAFGIIGSMYMHRRFVKDRK